MGLTEEVSVCFPEMELEIIGTLVTSTDGIMTTELADGLKELAADCCSQRKVHIVQEEELVLPEVVNQGDIALFCSSGKGKRAVVTEPSQGQNLVRSCYSFQSFGIHHFHLLDEEDGEGNRVGAARRPPRVMCETPVYQYARSINKLFDVMYWGWDSSKWNDELESSLLELLVAANEDLRPIVAKMDALASMHMGGGELLEMVQQISDDLQKAMTDRDPQAMGRLHQACFQLVETCWLLGLPDNLTRSIRRFERTKLGQSNTAGLRFAMDDCASSLGRYLASCPSDPAFGRLQGASEKLEKCLSGPQEQLLEDLGCFYQLRPSPMEAIMGSMGAPSSGSILQQGSDNKKTQHLMSIPAELLESPDGLDDWVGGACETLLGEAVTLGSILGRRLVPGDEEESSRVVISLLNAGFGYVVTAGRVTCLLDFSRACLRLSDPPSRRIANRRKDVARCLRLHGSLAEKASFRVSTSFQQALVKLKRHHQHSWVGAELEALWSVMLEQRKLEVLELWIGDRLVAADFAHPVGKAFYVATRFFERDEGIKKLQPGFLLAFVAARYLRDAGFEIYDLGGIDSSPMMSYKAYVSDVVERAAFVDMVRGARQLGQGGAPTLKRGTIIEGIAESHLFG